MNYSNMLVGQPASYEDILCEKCCLEESTVKVCLFCDKSVGVGEF